MRDARRLDSDENGARGPGACGSKGGSTEGGRARGRGEPRRSRRARRGPAARAPGRRAARRPAVGGQLRIATASRLRTPASGVRIPPAAIPWRSASRSGYRGRDFRARAPRVSGATGSARATPARTGSGDERAANRRALQRLRGGTRVPGGPAATRAPRDGPHRPGKGPAATALEERIRELSASRDRRRRGSTPRPSLGCRRRTVSTGSGRCRRTGSHPASPQLQQGRVVGDIVGLRAGRWPAVPSVAGRIRRLVAAGRCGPSTPTEPFLTNEGRPV